MITSKALTLLGIDHFIIAEPQEVTEYREAVEALKLRATVLELDMAYKDRYELCDRLGLTKSTGPGPARNFAWEHSIANGHAWHWVMDDNIKNFRRLQNGKRIKLATPIFFRIMEDFCLRFKNLGMAGPNYTMFAFTYNPSRMPPYYINTRIYSCNLIRNDIPFRWRGRYNEDTILSLDMLKRGWCTVQFNAFLQEKMNTQALPGGNTAEFYEAEGKKIEGHRYTDTGTLAKSKMQVKVHPDVSRLVQKFGRWHHHVNYERFRSNKLVLREGVELPQDAEEFGLTLAEL